MAISYDILLDNNLIYRIKYACFGSLNALQNQNMPYGVQQSETMRDNGLPNSSSSLRTLEDSFRVEDVKYIRYRWDWKDSYLSDVKKAVYLKEVKLLLSELPFIQDIIFFEEDFVYVSVKNQPADKVMFALSVVRNLTFDVSYSWCSLGNHKGGYFALRDRGLSPLQSLVFSQFVGVSRSTDWSSGTAESYNYVGEQPHFNSESHLFNLQTFGLESYKRLLEKDPEYAPWFQGSFAENRHGYKRGSHFSTARVRFEGFDGDGDVLSVDINGYIRFDTSPLNLGQTGSVCTAAYRSLFDCFAEAGDETPLLPNWFRNSALGFFTRSSVFSSDAEGVAVDNNGTRFEYMLDYINSL